MKFEELRLSECGQRQKTAREHGILGDAGTWLPQGLLRHHRLRGISFDFFVDWSARPPKIQDELWIKRPPSLGFFPDWESVSEDDVRSALRMDNTFVALAKFAAARRRPVVGMMFRREAQWPEQGSIRTMRLSDEKTTHARPDLRSVMAKIRRLSGGDVQIGRKGLIYAATTLECHLSRTTAAWPGDADLLITDDRHEPVVLVEWKKHNLDSPISGQCLANYYDASKAKPDNRKYDRLAHLCVDLGFGHPLPLIVIYYSTRREVLNVKVELISGRPENLHGGETDEMIMKPDDMAGSSAMLLRAVLRHATNMAGLAAFKHLQA